MQHPRLVRGEVLATGGVSTTHGACVLCCLQRRCGIHRADDFIPNLGVCEGEVRLRGHVCAEFRQLVRVQASDLLRHRLAGRGTQHSSEQTASRRRQVQQVCRDEGRRQFHFVGTPQHAEGGCFIQPRGVDFALHRPQHNRPLDRLAAVAHHAQHGASDAAVGCNEGSCGLLHQFAGRDKVVLRLLGHDWLQDCARKRPAVTRAQCSTLCEESRQRFGGALCSPLQQVVSQVLHAVPDVAVVELQRTGTHLQRIRHCRGLPGRGLLGDLQGFTCVVRSRVTRRPVQPPSIHSHHSHCGS